MIHLNPDIGASWGKGTYSRFLPAYLRLADTHIRYYTGGKEIAVNLIDGKAILFLKGGYSRVDRCGMGVNEWGIACSGNLYPCERLIGNDDNPSLCLGNVETGLNGMRHCACLARKGNRNPECVECSERHYCMRWCGCTNYAMTGDTDLVAPMMCASERAAILAAKHAFVTLSERGGDLFVDPVNRLGEIGLR